MNTFSIYVLSGAGLFSMGFYALIRYRDLIRKILGLNIMGNGVFMIFIATATRNTGPVPDPVPQALVLTGIVVAVCATAFALGLAERVRTETGTLNLPTVSSDDGS